jgi:hypothetical protein
MMAVFVLIVKIILLISALLMSIAAAGADSDGMGERCGVMAMMFTAALVILIVFGR